MKEYNLKKEEKKLLEDIFEKWIDGKKDHSGLFIGEEKLTLLKILADYNLITYKAKKDQSILRYNKNEKERIIYFATITTDGLGYLKNKRILSKKWNNPHDQILYRCMSELSKNKNVYCFSDFDLDGNRPDIFMITKSKKFNEMKPVVFEIKHSRNDFFNDIKKPEKRASYLKYCEKMYYVCDTNLILKEEIPVECGLIYINQFNEMKIIKEAPNKTLDNLKQEELVELLMTLVLRTEPEDLKVQVSISENKNFKKKYCEKYIARNCKNSLSITSEHKHMLSKIDGKSQLRVNIFDKNIIKDLIFWDLIQHDENGNMNKTIKGEQILKEISEKRKQIRNDWNDNIKFLHNGEVAVMVDMMDESTTSLLTIPYSKKYYNIKINIYHPIRRREDLPVVLNKIANEERNCFSRCFLMVNENVVINKEEVPKDIGIVFKKTNNNHHYIELFKRSKENKLTEMKESIIIERLMNNIRSDNSRYTLFY